MKVSAVVLTLDEERTLGRCLASLGWCDDILVVDCGSTDRTLEIAAAHAARVLHRPFDSFAGQRNFALEHGNLAHEWVLHLDADEAATDALAAEIDALAPGDGVDGYLVPSRMMLHGGWLRRAGMWPGYQARLGHASRLRFRQAGHGQREVVPEERLGRLTEPYLHFAFDHGFRHWLAKHVRYAADEAGEIVARRPDVRAAALLSRDSLRRRRAIKGAAQRLPLALRPFARFLYVYVLRRGFLDGRRGFVYAFMLSVYEGMIVVLGYEKRLIGNGAAQTTEESRPASTSAADEGA